MSRDIFSMTPIEENIGEDEFAHDSIHHGLQEHSLQVHAHNIVADTMARELRMRTISTTAKMKKGSHSASLLG